MAIRILIVILPKENKFPFLTDAFHRPYTCIYYGDHVADLALCDSTLLFIWQPA